MSAAVPKRRRGSTLLEVALAMIVMATCGLGLMRTHIALARHAQAAADRERAAFAAASIAEAALEPRAEPGAQWRARMAALVPDGLVAMSASGGGASIATVTWAAATQAHGPTPDGVALPVTCGDAAVAVAAGRACLALAFAR